MFINRVYPPDSGATGQLLSELAQGLSDLGWKVRVVASATTVGDPAAERADGVCVERVKGLSFTRRRHWRRAAAYMSLYPGLLWRALRAPAHSRVVTMSDPPLHLLLGVFIQKIKGGKLIHWAQDIYPELAENLGVLSPGGLLARMLRGLSTWGLRKHQAVVCVGACMRDRMLARGIEPERLWVIPNWANTDSIRPLPAVDNPFVRAHGLDGRRVVMYSGNMGLAHPFAAIVDAVEILKPRLPDVLFLFVGDGPRLDWLKDQVRVRNLGNMQFLPFQPKEDLAQSLSAGNLHLASMREDLEGLVVPSKVYGVLAAGRPCLFLGPENSEAARLILRNGCGEVLSNPDGPALAQHIEAWLSDEGRLYEAGRRARNAAVGFNHRQTIRAFAELLEKI